SVSEREFLESRRRELTALGVTESEWTEWSRAQSRLANAAGLLETATQSSDALAEGDDALVVRLSQLMHRLEISAAHDPALREIIALVEPASIQLNEAARALRDYRRRLDLDPAELQSVEARLAAIHDTARKHRVRPEALPALLAETDTRLLTLAEAADEAMLARRVADAEERYRAVALPLSAKRHFAANELAHRVTEAMQDL